MTALEFVAIAVLGYLCGSIQAGLWLGKALRGIDIREFGSGKTGFTNTARTLGYGPAILVMLIDLLKGAAPVLVAKLWLGDGSAQVVAGVAAMIGHIWPVFAGFRGGRAVLVAFAATTVMMPLLGPLMIVIGLLIALPFRYISLASVVGSGVMAGIIAALALAGRVPVAFGVWGVVAATIIVVLHRDNIERLRNGTEPKFGQGGTRRSKPADRGL
jgi:glycerol-3-phosphate acyltransferase PlsY